MKKLITVLALGVFVTAFASCKKDHTCECSVDGNTITLPLLKQTKGDAESACDAAEVTYKNASSEASCSLK